MNKRRKGVKDRRRGEKKIKWERGKGRNGEEGKRRKEERARKKEKKKVKKGRGYTRYKKESGKVRVYKGGREESHLIRYTV